MYRKSLLNKFMRNKHTDSLLQNGSSDKQRISHLVTINGQELASESSEPSVQDNREALQEFFNNSALQTGQITTNSSMNIEISNARPATSNFEASDAVSSRLQCVEKSQNAQLPRINAIKEQRQDTVKIDSVAVKEEGSDAGSAFTGKRSRIEGQVAYSSNALSERLIFVESTDRKDGTQDAQKTVFYLSAENLAALDNGSSAADTMSQSKAGNFSVVAQTKNMPKLKTSSSLQPQRRKRDVKGAEKEDQNFSRM